MSAAAKLRPFSRLHFDCRSLQGELSVDVSFNNEPRTVPNAIFARVRPTPVKNPVLIAQSAATAALLGVEIDVGKDISFLAGCEPEFGSPAAHCYAGHQFGYFSGQLGDGATMYLGEVAPGKL
jgi:uncharacterized protein YdiU (UPF0061 family)